MRAVVFDDVSRSIDVQAVEVAPPSTGEVTVRMTASGVCHTDRHVVSGAFPLGCPHVLGHEGSGVVEAVGPGVSSVGPGDTVVLASVPACGQCWYCRRGAANHCERSAELAAVAHFRAGGVAVRGFAGLGTFADRITVHEAATIPVTTTLPPEQLALIGCGVLTGVGAALNTAQVSPGCSVAVYGCGGVGLAAVQGARVGGAAQIVAVDPVESKRKLASTLGATATVDPTSTDPVDAVIQLNDGRGVDIAIEALGSAAVQLQAWQSVRKGGTAVFVGFPPGDDVLTLSAQAFLLRGTRMCASIYGGGDARVLVPRIVRMAEGGQLDLRSMVSRTISLDEVTTAFERMDRGDEVRSVISFSGH
jgi:S-(hydroxymethyl)glutathione dehydrogenase/alcohol dehydrogenase